MKVIETIQFRNWMAGLKDVNGRARILARIERVRLLGHFGDSESVCEGVSELRLAFGPGYRVYFCRRCSDLVILLGGRDKRSQKRDILAAHALAKEL